MMSEENLIEDLVENSNLEDEIILNFDEKYNRITKDSTKNYSKEEKASFIENDYTNKNHYSIITNESDSKSKSIHILMISTNMNFRYEFITLHQLFELVNSMVSSKSSLISNDDSIIKDIRYRDLRRFEYDPTQNEVPNMIQRKFVNLITLPPLRAVISHETLILIVPEGADELLFIFETNIQEWFDRINHSNLDTNMIENDIQFEFCAYEAILNTVITFHRNECKKITESSKSILNHFKNSSLVPIQYQEEMRIMKSFLASEKEKMAALREWMEKLLEDDEEMALMSLSKFYDEPSLYLAPMNSNVLKLHEDIESFFDPFLIDCYSIEANLNILRENIENSEDLVMLRLDTARNELLITNTIIAVVAANFAFGGFIAGIFGMNLDNAPRFEVWSYSFEIITIVTLFFVLMGIFLSLFYFKRKGVIP